jgi:hypothetical protein
LYRDLQKIEEFPLGGAARTPREQSVDRAHSFGERSVDGESTASCEQSVDRESSAFHEQSRKPAVD